MPSPWPPRHSGSCPSKLQDAFFGPVHGLGADLSRSFMGSAMLECMAWFVYLIECTDGSIYTGIAVDVDTRYAKHAAGKGARYTRSHPPRRLLAAFEHPDRSSASIADYRIKQLTATQKRALCRAHRPSRRRCAR